MLNISLIFDNASILYTYMFVYNITLIFLFWSTFLFINTNFKTIYNFNLFKFNTFFVTVFTISLLSIAGVPPFIGFFSKILILLSLSLSNFFLFYFFFFILLFLGLYFYVQNLRFLLTSTSSSLPHTHDFELRLPSSYFFCTLIFLTFSIFGIFFLDDLLLYFYWIFL